MGYGVMVFILLALASQLPGWWAIWQLRRHNRPRPDLPGGGGEFAAWLLKRHGLTAQVRVEAHDGPDHYDPVTRTVRLSRAYYATPSLTALAVAAHEVAHAHQHLTGDEAFLERMTLIERARWLHRLAGGALLAAPVLTVLAHTPAAAALSFTAGFIAMGVPVLIHLRTFTVEWDASFNHALPWLVETGRFDVADQRALKRVLRACAWTYAAQSLASLFNLWRWLSPARH